MEEFINLLGPCDHQSNVTAWFLVEHLKDEGEDRFRFERKGENLAEVVRQFCKDEYYPVVDKRLKVVIGLRFRSHEGLMAYLYRHHTFIATGVARDPFEARTDANARDAYSYIREGMGYYVSRVQRGVLQVGERYRSDKNDEALFSQVNVMRF